ncbi:MAG: 2'-5' RNA ligase family protein [Candidatus Peribacteraceae bacterium]|nr:2'-5' RNA ligase family protein [Candidatus Peribacteraceae bacterium]
MQFPLHSVFLALPLEGQAKWQFQAYQEALKPFADILAFQNPASPHLTLQFWPSVMEIEYPSIMEQAKKAAEAHVPFDVLIRGAGTFGSRGEDKVLFFTVPFSEPLARLRKSCPWPLDKPFSPHVTIARIRHPQRFNVVKKKVMKELATASFTTHVDTLRLYAEVNGNKQTPIQDFTLPPNV